MHPAPGSFLVAEPALSDPNFRRTIVLLCQHDDEGAFGLVLTRSAEVQLSEVANEPLPFDGLLRHGGPVQLDTLHVLHPYGDPGLGAEPLLDGVFWGGDFESLQQAARDGAIDGDRIQFFAGYAGWGPGQLEAEVDLGGWIVLDGDPELVYAEPSDALWRTLVRSLGGDYALLANYPDDPQLN